jgi:hypothetical protein
MNIARRFRGYRRRKHTYLRNQRNLRENKYIGSR